MNVQPVAVAEKSSSYLGRLQRALNSGSHYVASTIAPISFATASSGSSSFLYTALRYFTYLLIAVFIVVLLLTIVHYTIKPIFGIGGSSALITVAAGDWSKDWNDAAVVQYSDIPAKKTLPKSNFTVLFDMRVSNPTPSTDTGNMFVVAYKTTASQPIRSFGFLDTNPVPLTGDPSLIILYNSLTTQLEAHLIVSGGNSPGNKRASVNADIIPNTAYRVGVVVADSIFELYINGRVASSTTFAGETSAGGATDSFFSTPATYNKNIDIRNLFTLTRVATPGEISGYGESASFPATSGPPGTTPTSTCATSS